MGLFDQFPYTNFHELNLDWILQALKELEYTINQFVAINALKYADPIQWNITSQYEKNTIVIDPQSGTAYISVQPVPSGVSLTNENYWTVVFDLGQFVVRASKNFANTYEAETTLTATVSTAASGWIVWGDTLYKALVNITAGDSYVIGGNIAHFTMEDIIGHLENLTTTDKSNVVAAINEVAAEVLGKIGDLADLTTTDKSNLVAAINEVVTNLAAEVLARETADGNLVAAINEVAAQVLGKIGDLEDLSTTDKSNLVAAINEVDSKVENINPLQFVLPEYFRASGDGVTDDTVAIQAALNSAKVVYLSDAKTYLITQSLYLPRGVSIVGPGCIKITGNDFYNAIILNGDNIIDGITVIDSFNTFDESYSVIYALDTSNLFIKNVKFNNIHIGYCIRIDSSQFIEISYNSINECSFSGIMLINGCYDANIEHNYVYNCRHTSAGNKYPISISGYFLTARDCARRIKCNYNNIVELVAEWEGIDSHGVIDCEIIGNNIKGIRTGIILGASSTSANPLPESNKNLVISNNSIEFNGSLGGGIIISASGENTENIEENIIITNNNIKALSTPTAHSSATSCIAIRGTNNMISRNIEISNNIISGEHDGITLENYGTSTANIKNIEIYNNDISGGNSNEYTAINTNYIQHNFSNINIHNNNIHNITAGVSIRGVIDSYEPVSNEMINYYDNIDTNSYSEILYITVPRNSFNINTAYGRNGLKINDTSGTNAFWYCINPGSWKAIN